MSDWLCGALALVILAAALRLLDADATPPRPRGGNALGVLMWGPSGPKPYPAD